jgi:hypothetical protein
MTARPAWERRDDYARRKVDSVQVGPFRMVARPDSFTVCLGLPFALPNVERLARTRDAARKGAIDAARAQLADWAAELDALEHQEPGR